MTRLTKEIKERICRNAIEQSPANKELEEVNKELSKLALDVYNDNATNKEIEEFLEIKERIKKLPFEGGYFYEMSYVRCNFGGMRYTLYPPEDIIFFEFKKSPTYPAEHEFTKRFLRLDRERDSLKNQIQSLQVEIIAILNSCTTLEKLQKIWAESVNFLDGIETDAIKTNLPAIKIADLNEKLGISQ